MIPERCGLIVWLHHLKAVRGLERYGNVHYVSKKMKYAVIYVDQAQMEAVIDKLNHLNFVKEVERSYRSEIKTEYNSELPDRTHFYSL